MYNIHSDLPTWNKCREVCDFSHVVILLTHSVCIFFYEIRIIVHSDFFVQSQTDRQRCILVRAHRALAQVGSIINLQGVCYRGGH